MIGTLAFYVSLPFIRRNKGLIATDNGFRFYLSVRRRVRETLRHFLRPFLSPATMDVSFRFLLSVFRGSAVGAGVEVSASRAERRGRSVESGAVTSRSCVALPGPRLPAEETPAARNATLPWPWIMGIEWDVFAGAWAPVGGAEESERGRGVVLYPSLSGAPPHAPPSLPLLGRRGNASSWPRSP